jgi:hypothetical protein
LSQLFASGVTKSGDGTPAPLFYVSPTQINFQVPRNLNARTVSPGHPSATALIEIYLNGKLHRVGPISDHPGAFHGERHRRRRGSRA